MKRKVSGSARNTRRTQRLTWRAVARRRRMQPINNRVAREHDRQHKTPNALLHNDSTVAMTCCFSYCHHLRQTNSFDIFCWLILVVDLVCSNQFSIHSAVKCARAASKLHAVRCCSTRARASARVKNEPVQQSFFRKTTKKKPTMHHTLCTYKHIQNIQSQI